MARPPAFPEQFDPAPALLVADLAALPLRPDPLLAHLEGCPEVADVGLGTGDLEVGQQPPPGSAAGQEVSLDHHGVVRFERLSHPLGQRPEGLVPLKLRELAVDVGDVQVGQALEFGGVEPGVGLARAAHAAEYDRSLHRLFPRCCSIPCVRRLAHRPQMECEPSVLEWPTRRPHQAQYTGYSLGIA